MVSDQHGRGRNKNMELGELGWQWSHICGAEGDQDKETAATVMFNPLTQAQMTEEQDCRAGWTGLTVLPHLWGWGWSEWRTNCRNYARPHFSRCLKSDRTIPFSRPIRSQTQHRFWWEIGLTLGICHFFVDTIAVQVQTKALAKTTKNVTGYHTN